MIVASDMLRRMKDTPVIPGVKQIDHIPLALGAGASILFCLSGTIFDLMDAKSRLSGRDALLFAHVDLLSGVGKDAAGLEFLARHVGISGILSTRSALLRAAKKLGLLTIQRVFAVDSDSIHTGVQVVQQTSPDAVEILPGPVAPMIMKRLPIENFPPVIAGGLIETVNSVSEILGAPGIVAVSTSNTDLWGRVFRR